MYPVVKVERNRKTKICCRPVKKGEKNQKGMPMPKESLNNPSVIQETLSDGVHTNHKPTSAAT